MDWHPFSLGKFPSPTRKVCTSCWPPVDILNVVTKMKGGCCATGPLSMRTSRLLASLGQLLYGCIWWDFVVLWPSLPMLSGTYPKITRIKLICWLCLCFTGFCPMTDTKDFHWVMPSIGEKTHICASYIIMYCCFCEVIGCYSCFW